MALLQAEEGPDETQPELAGERVAQRPAEGVGRDDPEAEVEELPSLVAVLLLAHRP